MARRRSRKQMSQINVVPFIDVMLVLLIIFMVTAPLLVRNIDVDLPIAQADPSREAEQTPPIVLGVEADGRYFLYDDAGGRSYVGSEQEGIAMALAEHQSDAEDGRLDRDVLVYGDKHVEYDKVLRLLQALQDNVEEGRTVKLVTVIGEG